MDRPITTILIGAGQRGRIYASYALDNPNEMRVVGVAEPIEGLRRETVGKYDIPAENVFSTWEDVFAREKFADAVMICTQDKMHYAPAMAAIERSYDILLEKPISPEPSECAAIAGAAEKRGVKVVVCHVLRYTPFFSALKNIIDSGEIGEVVSVVHNENVGDFHHAHSFVRGNWRSRAESSPMILAKSCHDTDIIQWLIGKKCLRLSSFGSLKYFNRANCPPDAPTRCLDGCPHTSECPYDARKLYLGDDANMWFREAAANCVNPSVAQIETALKTGPYGRCVFQCDNDVVDHQTVNMEFEDGITAVFSMCSFTPEISRTIKIMGTKGQIRGAIEMNNIEVTDFLTRKTRTISTAHTGGHVGHGGGDGGLMKAFSAYVGGGEVGSEISTARVSAENHMISFAAEESRLNGGKVVEL
ncbi:oxidoreductase [Clostridia bacterium]|nr:oxidoreductase [Clostridia bacterium]